MNLRQLLTGLWCSIHEGIKEYENCGKCYLELNPSSFVTLCSSCLLNTTSKDDLILCSTTDCLFKINFQTKCLRYIDDCNYCANYKRTSIYVNDVDKIDSDNIEIIYDDILNEDCVTVFQNSDKGTSIKSSDNAIMSLGCNTVYNYLPNYKCKVPEYIINILDDDFVILPIEHVEAVINNGSLSVIGNLILDLSISESVSGLREPFIMKDENYDNTNGTTRRLENTTEIVSEDEIKIMNLNWKNSTMISFSTWGEINCMVFVLAFVDE